MLKINQFKGSKKRARGGDFKYEKQTLTTKSWIDLGWEDWLAMEWSNLENWEKWVWLGYPEEELGNWKEDLKWVCFGIEDERLYEAMNGEKTAKPLKREKAEDEQKRIMDIESDKNGRGWHLFIKAFNSRT